MKLIEINLGIANEFVMNIHRHHKPVVGHKFSLAAIVDGYVCGVVIVGRPVARALDRPNVMEVTRLCTDGHRNACSFLYAAAAREAKRRGCKWILTYILESENGSSLKAVGWIRTKTTRGGSWSCESRPRIDKHPIVKKHRYEKWM